MHEMSIAQSILDVVDEYMVNEDGKKLLEVAVEVGELVAEIAAASSEQANGIEQINRAVGEMDKVVQANAANAEETASASEEMSAQAEMIKGFIKDLLGVMEGSGTRKNQNKGTVPSMANEAALQTPKDTKKETAASEFKELTAEELIPFDDDLKDF